MGLLVDQLFSVSISQTHLYTCWFKNKSIWNFSYPASDYGFLFESLSKSVFLESVSCSIKVPLDLGCMPIFFSSFCSGEMVNSPFNGKVNT